MTDEELIARLRDPAIFGDPTHAWNGSDAKKEVNL